MGTAFPLPAGLPLDAVSWKQTPLVVRQVVIDLLAVIQQQAARIAELEARASQNSSNADRPPSSDPLYAKRTPSSGTQGRPGAKLGHPGHRQALLAPTEVIAVQPEACSCGQREFPETQPYYTHQVIELPEIQMVVKPIVLYEARCPGCGRSVKAELPEVHRYGYEPRLTALIGELSGSQRDRRSAVQEFCTSVLGVPISRGAMQRAVDRVSEAIRPHYEAIAEQARGAAGAACLACARSPAQGACKVQGKCLSFDTVEVPQLGRQLCVLSSYGCRPAMARGEPPGLARPTDSPAAGWPPQEPPWTRGSPTSRACAHPRRRPQVHRQNGGAVVTGARRA